MSNVPQGRRKQSRFEAQHQYYKLRDEVTALLLNNFGFSTEKYQKQIERIREQYKDHERGEEIAERMERKREEFIKWFIASEKDAVLAMARNIETEFTFANSIYPSDTPAKEEEFIERRKHLDAAISNCFVLKQEINYVIRNLPVDMNKYVHFADAIDQQVALYKGVRQADNRFLKDRRRKPATGGKPKKGEAP